MSGPSELQPGINLAGLFRSENGLGEAARLLAGTVDLSGIPYTTITYTRSPSRQGAAFQDHGDGVPGFDVNLLAVNGDGTTMFAADLGPELFERRHSVGFWAWETDRIPDRWAGALELVDEVWMPSEYACEAVRAASDKPVFNFPHAVVAPPAAKVGRAEVGLPAGFTFLFVFDFFSRVERKNPIGLIEAFRRAFPRPGEAHLVIKTAHGAQRRLECEQVLTAAGGREDIAVRDDQLPVDQVQALIGLCDCYVSLHRSEAFGLTMAEAMAQGRPVIATGYSGNLEFMNPGNSRLVAHRLVPVGEQAGFYSVTGSWAEPDVEDAARLMREVFEHPEEAATRARRAKAEVERDHSLAARAELLRRRYAEIRRDHLPSHRVWGSDWAAASAPLRAELRVSREPGRDLPTAAGGLYGAAARIARRAFRRLNMPYREQADEAGRGLVEALWEQQAELDRLRARVEAMEAERKGI